MNSFFKSFWAALLAFVVGTALVWLLGLLILTGVMAAFTPKPVQVSGNSVLVIDLANPIADSPSGKTTSINLSTYSILSANTLLDVLHALDNAASDDNIKGIYLNFKGDGLSGYSHGEELRAAIAKFKESGKFVIGYQDDFNFAQFSYYLQSVADKVFINPEGGLTWQGVSASAMFYKGLLDKLDVEVEIFRHGTFKSAVEPFIGDRMSPENKAQMSTVANSIWNVILDDVSASRGISKEDLNRYADELAVKTAEDAQKLGFIDGLLYRDQVMNLLAALVRGDEVTDYTAVEESEAPNMITLGEYILSSKMSGSKLSKNKVAVIYADGDIMEGEGYPGVVGGITTSDQLARARHDKDVKAVVFRVNSPGGSAMASEAMWREMELLRKEKPVVVSMGNYAASGGYYISCAADAIISNRTTLTGSIGVFGMMLNIEKALRNKLGITQDVVKTNTSADFGKSYRSVTASERDYMMAQIEGVYKTFVGHVADGRNMSFEEVDKISEGRVWLGVDAAQIGLVDGFGGLTEAIELAADRAGVAEDFRIYEITDDAGFWGMIQAFSASVKQSRIQDELGGVFSEYNYLKNTLSEPGVQARVPYYLEFN